MKSDYSRITFDPRKHFNSVRMQQGRVQVDADSNEQIDIVNHRVEKEALDIIGWCGAPLHYSGFHIVADLKDLSSEEQKLPENTLPKDGFPVKFKLPDFLISAGHYYVDGILCENDQVTSYLNQPDLPQLPPAINAAGWYLVYIDVWRRLLTALDDQSICEIALGGPDTATREKTVWQIKHWFAGANAATCLTKFPEFEKLIAPSDCTLSARTKPAQTSTDPCIVPPGAGYTGLENQLYRIEIHDGGEALDVTSGGAGTVATRVPNENSQIKVSGAWQVGQSIEIFSNKAGDDPMNGTLAYINNVDGAKKILTLDIDVSKIALDELRVRPAKATFKWSRDNGVVVTTIENIDGQKLTVHDLGRDDALGFKEGQWVEISDDGLELNGLPGQLAQITEIDSAINLITLNVTPSLTLKPDRHPKLRRWDGIGAVKFHPNDTADHFLDLENGVQVRFFKGAVKTGDYWTAAARTATADTQSGNVEWPRQGNQPIAQLPFDIRHHYCRLAILHWDGGKFDVVRDCRNLFPPITELTSLFYVSGENQEVRPDPTKPLDLLPLTQPLIVGVANGTAAVLNAEVRFQVTAGGGQISPFGPPGTFNQVNPTTLDVLTDNAGMARCAWKVDSTTQTQQVTATLQRVSDLTDTSFQPVHLPVIFTSNLSVASQVAYNPANCPDLKADNVTNVQDAIDHLCKVHQDGCCDVTVGKGGQFERLDEAIRKLIEQDKADICICLLAGDHELREGLKIEGRGRHVKIVGCGRGSRIIFPATEGGSQFLAGGLASFLLRDVELSGENVSIFFKSCENVAFEDCYLAQENQTNPFITIARASSIRFHRNAIEALFPVNRVRFLPAVVEGAPVLTDLFKLNRADFEVKSLDAASELASQPLTVRKRLASRLRDVSNVELSTRERDSYKTFGDALIAETPDARNLQASLVGIRASALRAAPGTAIVIEDAADTWIEDNDISGVVSLYGVPGSASLTQEEMKNIAVAIKQGNLKFSGSKAQFHLRNNNLYRLDVSEAMIRKLKTVVSSAGNSLEGVFRRSFVTNNEFHGGHNNFVSEHLALTSNSFERAEGGAGNGVADGAIYTGNFAPAEIVFFDASRGIQIAANLFIIIAHV